MPSTFKPMGKKIYSYSRRASARSDVERRGEVDTSVNEEDEDAVVFEVYHVRYSTYCEASSLTMPVGDMGNTWLCGIPQTDAVVHIAIH
jgi:hypothetical protein